MRAPHRATPDPISPGAIIAMIGLAIGASATAAVCSLSRRRVQLYRKLSLALVLSSSKQANVMLDSAS